MLVAVALLLAVSFSSIHEMNVGAAGISGALPDSVGSATTFYGTNPRVGITAEGTVSTQSGPNAIAFDSQNDLVFVADYLSGDVTVISGTSVVATLSFSSGYDPNGIAYDAYNGNIYVSLVGSPSAIGVITPDASTPSQSTVNVIQFSSYSAPGSIVAAPSGEVYVSLASANEVAVISGNTVVDSISVAPNPQWIVYDSYDAYLYVISDGTGSATITVINPSTNGIVNSFSGPVGALVYDPYMSTVYDVNSSEVLVITETSARSSQSLSLSGTVWAATPGTNGFIFAANQQLNSIDILNITSGLGFVGDVASGDSPQGILYAPATGYLYVSEYQSSEISVYLVTPCYPVSFQEYDLPLPVTWSVTIGGAVYSSSYSNFPVQLPEGTYSYNFESPVSTTDGPYTTTTNPSGSVDVTGSNYPSVTRTYSPEEFAAAFEETGLSSGQAWSVNLNGNTQSSTSSSITFSITLGSYSYSVSGPTGYQASPASGTIDVTGNVATDVSFSYVGLPSYMVTFNQGSLPAGNTWYVQMGGINESSTGSYLDMTLAEGTYTYSVYSPGYLASPSSGTIDLNSNQNVFVSFTGQSTSTLPLTFTESGLPSRTEWFVNVTGQGNLSSTSSSISFSLLPSTYSYTIYAPGYIADPSSGSIDLSVASSIAVNFIYSTVKYNIYFDESGLAQGISWYVNLAGVGNVTTTTPVLCVTLPTGIYDFSVFAAGYEAEPSSGQISVSTGSATTDIIFTAQVAPLRIYHDFMYNGQEYNVSMEVNQSIYGSIQGSQLHVLNVYLNEFLSFPDKAFINNIEIEPQGSTQTVAPSLVENITYDMLVWSQLNSTLLSDYFGPGSKSQQNLVVIQQGKWAQEAGTVIPDVINALTIVGDLSDILSSAPAPTVKEVAGIYSAVQAAFNGYKDVEKAYGNAAAESIYETLKSYGLVGNKNYSSLIVIANLSNLPSDKYQNLVSQLFGDTGSGETPSQQALSYVTNALIKITEYSVKQYYGDVSLSDLWSSLSSRVSNLISSVNQGTSDGSLVQAANDMYDQTFTDLTDTDPEITSVASGGASDATDISSGVADATDLSSNLFGPQALLAIASTVNSLYIAPQGQLLSQEIGVQGVLSDLYSSMNVAMSSLTGSTPNLSAYVAAGYLAGMIRSAWAQWFSVNTELNNWNINGFLTKSSWYSMVDNFISHQYNASYMMQYLRAMSNYANGVPVSGVTDSSFSQLLPENLLSQCYLGITLYESDLSQFATDVSGALNTAWNAIYSFAQNMAANISMIGGYVLNGIVVFSQTAYSEISSMSRDVMSFVGTASQDIGILVSDLTSGVENLWPFVEANVYSNESTTQNSTITVSSGGQRYGYNGNSFFSANLWGSGMLTGNGIYLFTVIPGSSNFSVSSGFTTSITPFVTTDLNSTAAANTYSVSPGINYTFTGSTGNSTFSVTPVYYELAFHLLGYYGEHWYAEVSNGNATCRVVASGPDANVLLPSGEYRYQIYINGSSTPVSSGDVKISGHNVDVTLAGPSEPIPLDDIYILVPLIILAIAAIAIVIRRNRN